MKAEALQAALAANPECLLLEPRDVYDRAIVGLTSNPRDSWPRPPGVMVVAYSRRLCVEAMVAAWGWSREDAEEWQDYNVEGAWVGERTPTFRI